MPDPSDETVSSETPGPETVDDETPGAETLGAGTGDWAENQSRLWESWFETARATMAATTPAGSGGHWQEVASQALEAWAGGTGALMEATTEYLTSAVDDATRLFEAATSSANGDSGTSADTADTGAYESAFRQVADTWWDNYERTIGRLLTSPSLGYTRELNEKVMQSMAAWVQFRRASFDYELLLGEAWAKSAERFSRRLASATEKGESPVSFRELLRLWTEVTDEVLVDAFSTDRFAQVQGRLVDAAMRYRIRERESVESFLKHSHIPTRTELDNIGRRVHHMKREIRDLRRALAEKQDKDDKGTATKPARPAKKGGKA